MRCKVCTFVGGLRDQEGLQLETPEQGVHSRAFRVCSGLVSGLELVTEPSFNFPSILFEMP